MLQNFFAKKAAQLKAAVSSSDKKPESSTEEKNAQVRSEKQNPQRSDRPQRGYVRTERSGNGSSRNEPSREGQSRNTQSARSSGAPRSGERSFARPGRNGAAAATRDRRAGKRFGNDRKDDRGFYGERKNQRNDFPNSEESYDFTGGDSKFVQTPVKGDVKFSDLALAPEILTSLNDMGITTMTPIQERSIPSLIEGRDLVGCSQTGSGKTAAFLIPILMRLKDDPSKNALILTPTRELADQVHEVAVKLSQNLVNFRCSLIVGGGRMGRQLQALKKNPRIVVATPGRLLDHLFNHALQLKSSSIVVLDEADRMLDMGFAPQIDKIFKNLAPQRQSMLFSATFSKQVTRLIEQNTKNPVRVQVESNHANKPQIKETFMDVSPTDKNRKLTEELSKRSGSVLIFVKTQSRVDKVAKGLKLDGFLVESIHGGRTQGQRKRAMENFKSGEFPILVATDIAARGLDVNDVAHVINYDPPQQLEDYVHRIGRTARAGKEGEALSLVCDNERALWAPIKRRAEKMRAKT